MAEPHPIEGLLATAMESIRSMVDVNTILGEPVETPNGTVILPISRVSFGFAAGGREYGGDGIAAAGQAEGEYSEQNNEDGYDQEYEQGYAGAARSRSARRARFPFAGGSGAGISLSPVGFLVVQREEVRLVSVHDRNALYDRLIDLIPRLAEWISGRRQQVAQAGAATGYQATGQGTPPTAAAGTSRPQAGNGAYVESAARPSQAGMIPLLD
ncbi:MAG: GerW family sporulation protein [Limnochordales bacterium]|nr:GerW family sporulation protein [Limnochordales bacterium]